MKPAILCLPLTLLPLLATAQETDLRSRPITTAPGKLGDLLRQWWKEGSAAGNVGDFYDNRDGGHSDLNTSPFPQLQRIVYTPDDIKSKLHWAAARSVRPGVVFGNSSTSAPPLLSGSNPRSYYCSPTGLALLYKQYVGNNLYIYPEHRDHDPGRNGPDEGFGDLFPTNTPYLIISQGSSGSDQPFMRAVPFTLAAFRPEVKARLIESGLLMPTVQMILRSTSKALKDPADYLTGKAHPTVFDGGNVDDLAMVQLAHRLTLETLPPVAQVAVVKESRPVRGRDFFEPEADLLDGERLCDTPGVIARLWRGADVERTMTISAEKSHDLNKKPLRYHWAILRGDPTRINIEHANKEGSIARITVKHPERLPIAPGSNIESNRVDIGVFVHNGHHFSAPAFVTFFSLDSEARAHDGKGRIREIGHGMAETRLEVKDWLALMRMAHMGAESGRARLLGLEKDDALEKLLTDYEAAAREQTAIQSALEKSEATRRARDRERLEFEKAIDSGKGKLDRDDLETLSRKLSAIRSEIKSADQASQEHRKELAKVNQRLAALLDRPWKEGKESLRRRVQHSLDGLASDPGFATSHRLLLEEALKADGPASRKLAGERQRLIGLGLAEETPQGLSFKLLNGKTPTRYEQAQIRRFNGILLAEVVYADFLQARILPHVVDHRLSVPRDWRDIHHYDEAGRHRGWSRWNGHGVSHFHVDGRMILEKDKLGRPRTAQGVDYVLKGKRFGPPGSVGLEMRPVRPIFLYSYASDDDVVGMAKEMPDP